MLEIKRNSYAQLPTVIFMFFAFIWTLPRSSNAQTFSYDALSTANHLVVNTDLFMSNDSEGKIIIACQIIIR